VTTGYLVDTDWIIDHLTGVAGVTARLTELRPAGLAVSIISLAELYEGVHYSRDPVRSEASLQQFLTGLSGHQHQRADTGEHRRRCWRSATQQVEALRIIRNGPGHASAILGLRRRRRAVSSRKPIQAG
jgi:predicted nucleic acid-binding protein